VIYFLKAEQDSESVKAGWIKIDKGKGEPK
jgi:hypothetical protein